MKLNSLVNNMEGKMSIFIVNAHVLVASHIHLSVRVIHIIIIH